MKQDTENALKLNPKYIIWDDYGNNYFPGVKQFVDNFVKDKYELINLGLPEGKFYKANEKLVGSEGVMIKL